MPEIELMGRGLNMTVTADKGALVELVESSIAMWDLWLIFGMMIVLIITYKILDKR